MSPETIATDPKIEHYPAPDITPRQPASSNQARITRIQDELEPLKELPEKVSQLTELVTRMADWMDNFEAKSQTPVAAGVTVQQVHEVVHGPAPVMPKSHWVFVTIPPAHINDQQTPVLRALDHAFGQVREAVVDAAARLQRAGEPKDLAKEKAMQMAPKTIRVNEAMVAPGFFPSLRVNNQWGGAANTPKMTNIVDPEAPNDLPGFKME